MVGLMFMESLENEAMRTQRYFINTNIYIYINHTQLILKIINVERSFLEPDGAVTESTSRGQAEGSRRFDWLA